MKNYLLISLGHSASAVFLDNSGSSQKVIGYEEERFSRIKADSQFPIDALNEIIRNVPFDHIKGCAIRVSHWFNFTDSEKDYKHDCCICKYFTQHDYDMLRNLSDDIEFVNPDFTHHDAHAWSAYEFLESNINAAQRQIIGSKPVYCLVADGFGNDKEVFSVYSKNSDEDPKLIHRAYGYNYSLGLFYQYATSYVGMKENQDEYKFLGYESHVFEEFDEYGLEIIRNYIGMISTTLATGILKNSVKPECKEDIDVEDMRKTKAFWYKIFNNALKELGFDIDDEERKDVTSWRARVAIAKIIQGAVESVLNQVIKYFNIDNVCLAGGSFYNVKLNNYILTHIQGVFSVIPAAGDQGAAIGMFAKDNKMVFPFGDLCWGERRLYNIEKLAKNNPRIKVYNITNEESEVNVINEIARYLADNKIVNLISGNMEFGPRALCHTSTLMLPSSDNTAKNNHMNKRNEVMPCAPVITEENAKELFSKEELARVIGSDDYMICTHVYKRDSSKYYAGVMHSIPGTRFYSGRPQIVHLGSFMHKLLNKVQKLTDMKCLVNTSFNVHGNPIVFDTMDIISNFKFQCEHAEEGEKPYLFILKHEE